MADRSDSGPAQRASWVCDRHVGPDASLLVAGFAWLYVLQPDAEDAGQRRAGELSRSGAGHLAHDAQPDRCHLSSVIVKMILVTYKFDVHPPKIGVLPTAGATVRRPEGGGLRRRA